MAEHVPEIIPSLTPRTKYSVSSDALESMPRRVRRFYENQNRTLDELSSVQVERGALENVAAGEADDRSAAIGSRVSLCVNVVLLAMKICVVIWSGSLSVIASALDSVLDLVSGAVLWGAARVAKKATFERYPTGAGRAEPVAMVAFSTIMFMVSLQVVVEAVQRIVKNTSDSAASLLSTLLIVGVVVMKAALFALCRFALRSTPTTRALAQDHFNDVFTNSFGLIFFYLGAHYPRYGWLDPAGALLFSLFIMYSWTQNGLEHARNLMGLTAGPDFTRQVTSVCMSHSTLIQKIDTVQAFHLGNEIVVEVDIIMDPEATVRVSHDIAESLQLRLENLEGVGRAIVHIDYEADHTPVAQTAPGSVTWRHRR